MEIIQMWIKRIIFKKVSKITMRIFDVGREKLIRHFLNIYNAKTAIIIYNVLTYSPLENIITYLGCKFGLSKAVILIILAIVL